LEKGRLLIVTPFEKETKRITTAPRVVSLSKALSKSLQGQRKVKKHTAKMKEIK